MARPTPLQRYLLVQRSLDRELAAALRDAAREGERIVNSLAGNEIDRAQKAIIVRELRAAQAQLWGNVTQATRAAMQRAGQSAADGENLLRATVFKGFDDLAVAMKAKAQVHIQNYISHTENGMSLSEKVYRTQALTNGLVDKEIGRSLLLGEGHTKLAKRVKGLINPATPGGVSYAASRLARTELNSAFHYTQIDQRAGEPWTAGMKWELSGSHPVPDECNAYASSVHYSGGDPGVFKADDVPGKPHPNCLCYLTTVQVGEEEMMQKFLNGDYDSYIDGQIQKYAPEQIVTQRLPLGSPVLGYTDRQRGRLRRAGLTDRQYEARVKKARERRARRRVVV